MGTPTTVEEFMRAMRRRRTREHDDLIQAEIVLANEIMRQEPNVSRGVALERAARVLRAATADYCA